MQVTFAPHCCFFSALSKDMLNVPIVTFLKLYAPKSVTQKSALPKPILIIHPCMDKKVSKLVVSSLRPQL